MRIWGMVTGGLLVLAACCPLLSKNGISVNAFQVELGLKAGFVLVPIGLAIGGLSWLRQPWTKRLSVLLAVLALGIALNYWWQGSHLDALAWGTLLLLLAALLAVGFTGFRLLRGKP